MNYLSVASAFQKLHHKNCYCCNSCCGNYGINKLQQRIAMETSFATWFGKERYYTQQDFFKANQQYTLAQQILNRYTNSFTLSSYHEDEYARRKAIELLVDDVYSQIEGR